MFDDGTGHSRRVMVTLTTNGPINAGRPLLKIISMTLGADLRFTR